jgi:hypothetical protein
MGSVLQTISQSSGGASHTTGADTNTDKHPQGSKVNVL